MFNEICRFIAGQTGFALGSTLQVGHYVQNAPVRCALVQEDGGDPNFYSPDMANLHISFLCRAASSGEAREDAWTIYRALHGTSGWNIPRESGSGEDYLAMTIEAIATPQYLGEDANRRHLYSLTLIFRMEEGTCEPISASGSGSV